jgi:hypothetical protein
MDAVRAGVEVLSISSRKQVRESLVRRPESNRGLFPMFSSSAFVRFRRVYLGRSVCMQLLPHDFLLLSSGIVALHSLRSLTREQGCVPRAFNRSLASFRGNVRGNSYYSPSTYVTSSATTESSPLPPALRTAVWDTPHPTLPKMVFRRDLCSLVR